MRRIYCDRCGKEIIGMMNVTRVSLLEPNVDGSEWTPRNVLSPHFEICMKCLDEAVKAITTKRKPKQPKLPEMKKPELKQLDGGKIEALLAAGWSMDMIADEFNVRPVDISKNDKGEYWAWM